MRKIKIFDTTLRDGEQTPGVNLNIEEKLQIARGLEKLGVDVIEAGFAVSSPGDFNAVSAVAKEIKNSTIASLSRAIEKDIDASYEALKNAVSPRIHVFLATSDIHLKYKLKMTEEEALARAISAVKYAKKYCSDVEFSAEDAGRTNLPYLHRVLEAVIAAGATCVNIPDTVGYVTPREFGEKINSVMQNVKGIEKVDVSVHCHNDLGLAVANSLEAVLNGANQLECTINGIGERAGNAAMEEIIMGIATRPYFYNVTHNIDTKQISRMSKLVSSLTGISIQPNKAVVGDNAFAHESGVHQHGMLANKSTYEIMTPESVGLKENKFSLGKLSGKNAFENHLKEIGYVLEKDALDDAFAKFKDLADKKKVVSEEDIQALVGERMSHIPNTYELKSFQIYSGNKMISTATIELKLDKKVWTEAATGDGPVDAAFKAIDKITKMPVSLDAYAIRALTGGEDALGETTVRLKSESGALVTGRGISTDIIESSVKAYINAINRLILLS